MYRIPDYDMRLMGHCFVDEAWGYKELNYEKLKSAIISVCNTLKSCNGLLTAPLCEKTIILNSKDAYKKYEATAFHTFNEMYHFGVQITNCSDLHILGIWLWHGIGDASTLNKIALMIANEYNDVYYKETEPHSMYIKTNEPDVHDIVSRWRTSYFAYFFCHICLYLYRCLWFRRFFLPRRKRMLITPPQVDGSRTYRTLCYLQNIIQMHNIRLWVCNSNEKYLFGNRVFPLITTLANLQLDVEKSKISQNLLLHHWRNLESPFVGTMNQIKINSLLKFNHPEFDGPPAFHVPQHLAHDILLTNPVGSETGVVVHFGELFAS